MSWKPDITVAAIVEVDERFLCVEELIHNQRVFNQPAGHVESGEDFLRAVCRETLEETGWQFEPQWFLGVYRWQAPAKPRSTLRFAYVGRVHGHEQRRVLDAPVVAAHWLTRAQLLEPERKLRTPLVLQCIDDYLAGVRLPLRAVAELSRDPDPSS
ncbi:MAG: NUDIX hydrolase [Steroidobacteraceae bacterium]